MNDWVSVHDSLPEDKTLKKYRVKVLTGSMCVSESERIVLGRMSSTGFRWMVGDWQKVTHWKEWEGEPVNYLRGDT